MSETLLLWAGVLLGGMTPTLAGLCVHYWIGENQ